MAAKNLVNMQSLSAPDAQALWMAEAIPSDQFLLYAFTGVAATAAQVANELHERARHIADMRLRVRGVPHSVGFPVWQPTEVSADSIRIHEVASWSQCLDLLGTQMRQQVDPSVMPWRIHVFTPVEGAPGANGATTVVVLQISHALADGSLASAIARQLFSPPQSLPMTDTVECASDGALLWRSCQRAPSGAARLAAAMWRAHRAYRRSPPRIASAGAALTSLNTLPDDTRQLRVIRTDRDTLSSIGPTVTAAALVVIGAALSDHLGVTAGLRSEVLIAKKPPRLARNHFRSVGIDLHVDQIDWTTRADLIRSQLVCAAADTPSRLARAQADAAAAMPALIHRYGVKAFDTSTIPATVSGNTVVSSVFRGPRDLTLRGGRVIFTAGFPALSPVQTLTHGVHGIGDQIALSVCASPAGLPDVDAYCARISTLLTT